PSVFPAVNWNELERLDSCAEEGYIQLVSKDTLSRFLRVLAVEVHESKTSPNLNSLFQIKCDAEIVGNDFHLVGKVVPTNFLIRRVDQISEIHVHTRDLRFGVPDRHVRPAVDVAVSRAQRDQRIWWKRVLVVRVKWARPAELLQPVPPIGASRLDRDRGRQQN